MASLSNSALDQLFVTARTYNQFHDQPVTPDLLRQLWDLARLGPTSANCSPLRVVFITSAEGKERLRPALSAGNVDKTMAAPVTAIFAQDMQFYDRLPELFPHVDARPWFTGSPERIEENAFRNSSLQAAYVILAARALGLDCGPMSGFDPAALDAEFFPDGRYKSNFLCNLGYGKADELKPRLPRLTFDDACQIV